MGNAVTGQGSPEAAAGRDRPRDGAPQLTEKLAVIRAMKQVQTISCKKIEKQAATQVTQRNLIF